MELLRRHVGRAANDRGAVRRDLEETRRAEVSDLEHIVFGHQDVGRPQVAMDDAGVVRVIDGVADLAGEIERAVELERSARRDDVLERLAMHVLHDDEEDVVLFFRRGDRDDVRVVHAGEQAWLAQQLAEVHVLTVRNLDRDLLVDPRVLRQVHGAEAAAPERSDDLVLPEVLPFE